MRNSPTLPSTSPRLRLIDATLPALESIVANLREADRRELAAQRWTDDLTSVPGDIINHCGPFMWVVEYEGVPVAAVGAVQQWPGVVSAWMFATDSFPKVGFYLTKFIKKAMIPSLVRLGCHRCEARSIEGHTEAHRWLRLLGATEECRLKRYGKGGEDFLVFRWDRPDVHDTQSP